MIHEYANTIESNTRRSFLGLLKGNKFELYSTIVLCIFAYLFFQWAYPFPNTYADTGAFITVAGNGLIGNYRPIGYSWFMAFSHFINPHPDVLVFLQTILYFVSTHVFYLILKHFFYSGNKPFWRIFYFVFILSPTCIYLCNFVISDLLFIALTNLWLASLIWIIGTRNSIAVLWNALFLILLLQTRYISLFYPLITIVGLFFAVFKINKLRFIVYAALQVIVFAAVIWFTTGQTEKNIGVSVFSAFGGWQKANNAMHIMPYIRLSPDDIKDPEIRKIHAFISTHSPKELYPPKDSVVVLYVWSNYGPMKQYMFHLKGNGQKSYLHYWHLASVPLGKWGGYMIKRFPVEFAKYYMYPNFLYLFSLYNEALFEFPNPSEQMRKWFNWGNRSAQPHYTFFHDFLAVTVSKSYNILWVGLALSIFSLFFYKRLKITPLQHRILIMVSFFCVMYTVMSVYASPLVLRYMLVLRHSLILLPFLTFQNFFVNRK